MKMTDYAPRSTLLDNDIFLGDGENGTFNITAQNLASELKKRNEIKNAAELYDWLDGSGIPLELRKSLFRGKNLGNALTKEQAKNIVNGSFKGFFIGDYWEMSNNKWRIVDFNYWNYASQISTPNLLIMPDAPILNIVPMCETRVSIANIGYVGSDFFINKKKTYDDFVFSLFGENNIISRTSYCQNAFTGNRTSLIGVPDTKIDLPTEANLYGTNYLRDNGGYMSFSQDPLQIALFAIDQSHIPSSPKQTYWLKEAVSANTYLDVTHDGLINSSWPDTARGVRPLFGLSGAAAAA